MKSHGHEPAWPNVAGLSSPVQQAEIKLLLARRWPPLKPLPVFKFETDEYRASIEFDKIRGEWFCRKTSLLSNKVEELRGGLAAIITALPHAQAEVSAECLAVDPPEQELEKDAARRLHAIREWSENYENGAFYSGLQGYLSESQRDEIADSIRLTLTARQLQCNPKNVAYVFDALSKAGGKLATLIEIAQRNKAQQRADVPAKVQAPATDTERHAPVAPIHPTRERRLQKRKTPATAYVELGDNNGGLVLNISETGMAVTAAVPLVAVDLLPRICFQLPNSGQSIEISARIVWLAESKKSAGIRFIDLDAASREQISNWIASEEPTTEFAGLTPAPVERLIATTIENFPEEPVESVFQVQDQPYGPELIPHTASRALKIVTPEVLDTDPPPFVEVLDEKVRQHATVAGFAPQIRTGKASSSAPRFESSPSRSRVLEISGFQVAAVVLLFAMVSLAVALTVGRVPFAKHFRDNPESVSAVAATSPPLRDSPGDTNSRASNSPETTPFVAPAVNPSAPATTGSPSGTPPAQSLHAPPQDSSSRVAQVEPSSATATRSFTDSDNPAAKPELKESADPIARKAPPTNSLPVHLPRALSPISGTPANSAPPRVALATRPTPHLSLPSTILVTGPGNGSKPFRLTLPERPIAASSSFAMTSQLSVLVPPEPGPAAAHRPARLQAGQLISFAWPSYPRPGDRYRSSETVKVRTTIGKLGQVLDVKLVSGSTTLFPAAKSAIRLWRYQPTLLNKNPVQSQQDVTIEFRPPVYSSRVTTRHPSHN
jgi:Gram-negative bacterial TonB protein C-terminal/PilZ domain